MVKASPTDLNGKLVYMSENFKLVHSKHINLSRKWNWQNRSKWLKMANLQMNLKKKPVEKGSIANAVQRSAID